MSFKRKKNVHNTNCCVYDCHSRKGADRKIHFHYFPQKNSGIHVKVLNAFGIGENVDKRKAWENVLLMGKPVTSTMPVCSKHFTKKDYCAKGTKLLQPKLNRFAVPSQNLPSKSIYAKLKKNASPRRERLHKRQKPRESVVAAPLCATEVPNMIEHELPTEIRSYENLSMNEKVAVQNLLELHSNSNQCRTVDKEVQVCSGDILITFVSTITTDSQLNSLTGIPTFQLLDSLIQLVTKLYPDQKQHKLGVKDRIILVFMKLKMSVKFNILSFLFKISPTSCKNTFDNYIFYLANILKSVIHWPSVEELQQNIPLCFKSFKSVRIVLDCFEIPIEKPKCLCCRIRTTKVDRR